MRYAKAAALISVTAMLGVAGCGGGGEAPTSTPASAPPGAPAAGTAAAPESYDIDALVASADVARGQTLFLQCRACHGLEQGGMNKVGPNLHGMFGREAGKAAGFDYSDAVANSGIVWSAKTLDQWLARPSEFLPGNRMVFVGVPKPADRAALIAYIQQETGAATP